MTGRNPWAVLGVAEDAPFQDVQRAFRRRVKQTHPDSGGSAGEFASVVQAFAAIRQSFPVASAGRAAAPTAGPGTRSTPYDGWLRSCPPSATWNDDGSTGPFDFDRTVGLWSAPTTTSPSDEEFTALLHREMTKARAVTVGV